MTMKSRSSNSAIFLHICITISALYTLNGILRGLSQLQYIDFDKDRSVVLLNSTDLSYEEQIPVKNNACLHILHGIYVKDSESASIIDEWEVNLKSILSNAPIENDLHIHVLTNNYATKAIEEKIKETNLIEGSRWRNRVSLTLHNVESKLEDWRNILNEKLRGSEIDQRVSIGGYFRLFAHTVLKERGIDEVVYMDTDVVVLANLNDLVRSMNTTHPDNESIIWQYAKESSNSGFMVLNMQKFHIFWDLLSKLPAIDKRSTNDQALLALVAEKWPFVYNGVIPDQWNVHLGHGWRNAPHQMLGLDRVAMVHFTGGFGDSYFSEPGLEKYCGGKDPNGFVRGKHCKDKYLDEFHASWGLADYYIRISWKFLIYFASTKISHDADGFAFNFEIVIH